MIRIFLSRALDVLLRRRREARLSEEVQAHLELLTDEYVGQGMSREEARLAARRAFGGVDRIKTIYRDQRGLPAVDSLMQDVRYAVRLLLKDRRFTLAAVAALALGIGANTTAFTFVNAALFRQLPLHEPERLVAFTTKDATGRLVGVSYADFKDWREASRAFSQIIVSIEVPMNVSDEGLPPERYWGSLVSIDAFRLLGRTPILGREFTVDDDKPDSNVAIIAHSLWKGRYGGDPAIVGRTIRLNEVPVTIVGVMPPTFHFMTVVEIWRPSGTALASTLNAKRDARTPFTYAVGRLADGITLAQAQAELNTLTSNLAQQYPDTNTGMTVSLVSVQEMLLGPLQNMFLMVMGAVAFVLLIACVNVANLLLARAVHRSREMALRFSLGATRWRVVRQLLVESLVLALLGGAAGLAIATYGVRLFSAAVADMMGSWQNPPDFFLEFSMDDRVYIFAALVCLGATVLFGLAPALHVSKASANDVLKDGGRNTTSGRARRWSSVLMVAQLALTLVLLAGAGFLARNFLALYRAGQVTDTSGIVTMRLSMAQPKYPTPERKKEFYQQLGERLASVPEFSSASVASDIPFVPLLVLPRQLSIDGRSQTPGENPPTVSYLYAGPRYFQTLRLRMIRGRELDERDARPGQEGVVVNERFASMFFPNGDGLGHRIRLMNAATPNAPAAWLTIVGISPTMPQAMTDKEPQPVVYAHVNAEPAPTRFASVIVQSAMEPAAVVSRLREEMRKVDPDLPGYWVQTMDQVLASSRWMHRIFGAMLAFLASIALVLASVGLYAVTAHGVAQRAHEIGIRMALGADASRVLWLFVRHTLGLIVSGLAIGVTGVLAGGQILQSFLGQIGQVHVSSKDPVTLVAAAVLLVVVASAACFLPARRAARLDPVVGLRDE
jgi:putative ABC transport system permease protein